MDSILQLFEDRIKENKELTPKMKDILKTSLELFAEKGYSNTSTKDIAQAACVAEGTIFKHFGSKENLLYASLIPLLRHTLAEDWREQLISSKSGIEKKTFGGFLEEVLASRIYYANENLKVMKVLYTEYLYQGDMRNNLMDLIPEDLVTEIDGILTYFKQKQEIVNIPNKEVFRLIIGTVMTFVLAQEAIPTEGEKKKQEIRHMLSFITKGLLPDSCVDNEND